MFARVHHRRCFLCNAQLLVVHCLLQVKATPTFRLYRQRECVSVVTGTNDKKLMGGILAQLFPAELVNHEREIAETMALEEEQQPVAAAAAR